MKKSLLITGIFILILGLSGALSPAMARIKLVALPERGDTVIRLDNPSATLIEEERVLTLQTGVNKVDFSWHGVSIDEDSIRLTLLSHADRATLLNVSYPPNEQALVWEIHSPEALEITVRISYLLSNIDRLIAYKAVANKEETNLDLKAFLVLRNFSGEDFEGAALLLEEGWDVRETVKHEETMQLLALKKGAVPIEKRWTFDAAKLPWDPEKLDTNVGIPVSYRIENSTEAGLGSGMLSEGKVRVFQADGHGGTIFLGEDRTPPVPVGEEMVIAIGDSRDLVVTQQKMREDRINVRRNDKNRIVLYDTEEVVKATIRNFKDTPAALTMIQHIPGQWEMKECNMEYTRKDASTLEFLVSLPARGELELVMSYIRRNIR